MKKERKINLIVIMPNPEETSRNLTRALLKYGKDVKICNGKIIT